MLRPKVNVDYSISDFFLSIKSLKKGKCDFDDQDKFLVNHARTGIRLALTSLELPKKAKIGMVAYNCYTVMNAIKEAGYSIVFLDITDNMTLDLEDLASKRNNLDAIIITHLFGIPNDIAKIKAKYADLPIIEDCAHAYGSRSSYYTVGTLGDIAVYSVGLGKFPSIGDGGIVKVNNNSYLETVKKEYANLQPQSLFAELKAIFKNVVYGIMHTKVLYNLITLRAKKQQRASNQLLTMYEHKEGKGFKTTKIIFDKREKSIQKRIREQQHNMNTALEWLRDLNSVTIPFIEVDKFNCFMLPIITDDKARVISALKSKKLEIGAHFSKSIDWATLFGYELGNCPNAEKITKQNLIIPVYYRLKLR